jgi:endonuclease I
VNNKKLLLSLILIPAVWICFGQVPVGYYDSSKGLSGTSLKAALHSIVIRNHKRIPWESSAIESWSVLYKSDEDPQNPGNVIMVYTGQSIKAHDSIGHHQWEREHIWARSHGDFDDIQIPKCDLHNLKPVDGSFNGPAGKWYKDYDKGGIPFKKDGIETECFTDNDSWEPREEDKGDIARILFYMDVRYEGGKEGLDLQLIDEVNTVLKTDSGKVGSYGKLSTLLEWNQLDPVDDFERNRNEVIYSYQKNRNPFIDHPEFADLLWKEKAGGTGSGLVLVFPVPSSDFIHIVWNGKNPGQGKLVNSNGGAEMEFIAEGLTTIPILGKKPGLYFIHIFDGDHVYTRKVMISRQGK